MIDVRDEEAKVPDTIPELGDDLNGEDEHLNDQPNMKRTFKDSVFCDLFSVRSRVLELYRELHPDDIMTSVDDLRIITLKSVLVNGMYNDLGFRVSDRLIMLVEAQSTWTPNNAVRALLYYAGTLKRWIKAKRINLYNGPAVKLPTSEIYVVYTGTQKNIMDNISIARDFLSGGYGAIDVAVKVIRDGNGGILSEYVKFAKIGDKLRKEFGPGRNTARKTVEYCIENDILKSYLIERQSEVIDMLDDLFDEEELRKIYDEDLVRRTKEEERAKARLAQEQLQKEVRLAQEQARLAQERLQTYAVTMLKDGVPPEKVAFYTGLSADFVEELSRKVLTLA